MSYFKKMLQNLQQETNPYNQQSSDDFLPQIPNERQKINRVYTSQKIKTIQSLLPIKIRMLNQMEQKKLKMQQSRMQLQRNKQSRRQYSRYERDFMYIPKSDNQIKQQLDNKIQIKMMSKIIDLLERQKMSVPNISTPMGSTSKQHPIVINNILRDSPVAKLERSLLEKDIKIKILEDQRQLIKSYHHQENFKHNFRSNRPSVYGFEIIGKEQRKKEYSEFQNSIDRFDERNYRSKDYLKNQQNKLNSQKASFCQDFDLNQKRQKKQFNTEIKEINMKVNSHFVSQDFSQSIKVQNFPQIEQKININNQSGENFKSDNKQQTPTNIAKKQQSQSFQEPPITITIKRPVLFQIPMNQNKVNNISLAEAFQKRLGGLSSEKRKQQKRLKVQQANKIKNLKNKDQAQRQSQQNQSIISTSFQSKNKKIRQQKKIKGNQINITPQNFVATQKASIHRQLSTDLMDRLINGSRAKITKKQMHQLTRKNYQKLPEVKKKKEDQKKKIQEIERLNRIRQYQKQLRSASNSVSTL